MSTAADRRWFEAVATIPLCVLWHDTGEHVAHRDEGKGMGLKTASHMTARLCAACHHEIGNGNKLARAERRALMDRAIVLTHDALIRNGRLLLK